MMVVYPPSSEELPLDVAGFSLDITVEVDGRRSDPFNLRDLKEKLVSCK